MKGSEKREVKITCRITKSVERMLNTYEGESIGDKICAMTKIAQQLNTHGLLEDRLKLMKEIENLNDTMQLVNKLCNNLKSMNKRYLEELLEKDRKIISMSVAEDGYIADENIIKKMLRLNELTGVDNSVADVHRLYESKGYANDEIRECVEELAEAFKEQEIKEQENSGHEVIIENMNVEV